MNKIFQRETIKKIFPFSILIVIITLSIFLGRFRDNYNDDMALIHKDSITIDELEWNFVKAVLYENHLAANIQARILAEKLSSDMLSSYPDLTELQYEMRNFDNIENPKFIQLIRKNLENEYFGLKNDENNVFICNDKGIIAQISFSGTMYNESPNTWQDVFNHAKNPALTKNAIAKILNHQFGLIYTEHQFDSEETPIMLDSEISENAIHNLFNKFGIDSLKNIEFLAPAYITDTGDIFGVDDFDLYGNKVKNDKLVVVQRFNLYQQLTVKHQDEIEKFQIFRNSLIKERREALIKEIFSMALISILGILAIYLMMTFNNSVFHHKE